MEKAVAMMKVEAARSSPMKDIDNEKNRHVVAVFFNVIRVVM